MKWQYTDGSAKEIWEKLAHSPTTQERAITLENEKVREHPQLSWRVVEKTSSGFHSQWILDAGNKKANKGRLAH